MKKRSHAKTRRHGARRPINLTKSKAKGARATSFARGVSTRSAVYGCIRTVKGDPNLIITPEMGIGALGVNRIGLGTCLNTQLGLKGENRYAGDEIQNSWSVQDVINDADGRRH
jgi:hypothetical protein